MSFLLLPFLIMTTIFQCKKVIDSFKDN
jgi:hypothetical protein